LIFEKGEPILGILIFVYALGSNPAARQLIRYEIADIVIVQPAIRCRGRFSAGCSTEPN